MNRTQQQSMLLSASRSRPALAGGVRRGMTLIETIVSMALISVALTTIYSMSSMFLTNSRQLQAQADLENSAQVAVMRMVSDLSDSHPASVTTGPAPVGVVFLSPRDGSDRFQRDAAGALYWQKWVCYYLDGNRQLVRAQIPFAPVTTPPNPTHSTADFQTQGTRRVVARNVTGMQVGGTSLVSITLGFATTVYTTNDMQISITDAVGPRN